MKLIRAALITAAMITSSFVAVHPAEASVTLDAQTLPYYQVYDNVHQEARPLVYTVRSGDTLSSIAQRFGMDWKVLYCANEKVIGSNPDRIDPGQKLVIESGKCSYKDASRKTTSTTGYVTGTPEQIAWAMLSNYSDRQQEYGCLNDIIMGESSWNIHAYNSGSGAYGIPQALPGWKMAGSWGEDWQNSAYVQLFWMIKVYIPSVYGTPCAAWAFHRANNYY